MLSTQFKKALQYACDIHQTQVRKGGQIPYIAHLLAVASLVLEHGGGEDEAVAALLHDAVEDQGVELDYIRSAFGENVAGLVEHCTDSFARDPKRKQPWLERKLAYIERLKTASAPALLISAADKLHNARAILGDYRDFGNAVWDRFQGSRDQVLWYYLELLAVFKASKCHPRLVRELDEVVTRLSALVEAGDGDPARPA